MLRSKNIRRSIGALAIFAMVSFHAVSAWAAACDDCDMMDMGCCPDGSDQSEDAPASDELNRASCCEVTPIEAMAALSELTPAAFESSSVDQLAVAAAVDPIDVQAPLARVELPRAFGRALAPPPTRTTVLLL